MTQQEIRKTEKATAAIQMIRDGRFYVQDPKSMVSKAIEQYKYADEYASWVCIDVTMILEAIFEVVTFNDQAAADKVDKVICAADEMMAAYSQL